MRADTPRWIASVTKLHIASSILKLYERGLIRLDASMSTYLPQTLIGGLHRLGDSAISFSESSISPFAHFWREKRDCAILLPLWQK